MDKVRVRFLVIAWLSMVFYLPGADVLVVRTIDEAPWYWWDLAYVLYAQLLLALVVVLTVLFPVRVPIIRIFGRSPTVDEMRAGLTLSVYLYLFSWAAAYLLFLPLSFWVPSFVNYWFIELPDLIYFDFGTYPAAPNALNFISLCVVAPLLEEFAFRGVILHRWARKFGVRSAVLWSSVVFGIVHPDFLGAFAFGVGMCVLYLRTQSLLLPILCHGAYNILVWLSEIGFIIKDGPEHRFTLEQFQSEWLYGLLAGLIVVVWTWLYFRKPKPEIVWRLPTV